MRDRKRTTATLLAALGLLAGCDSAERDTVLQGAESAVSTLGTSLIRAFFQSIANEDTDRPINTVKRRMSSSGIT